MSSLFSDNVSAHTCLMLPYIACLSIYSTLRRPKLGIRLNDNYQFAMNMTNLHAHTHMHAQSLVLGGKSWGL